MQGSAGKIAGRECALVMPAYNEEEAIAGVVAEWADVAKSIGGALVVLNDGSTDDTLKTLRRLEGDHPELIVIDKPNSGHGPTCAHGYKWAIEKGFEWVFQTDSDGQTNSEEFLEAWELRDEHDFILGLRRTRGDGIGRWVISRVLRLAIWTVFSTHVRDANVPFRLMRAEKLKPLLELVPDDLFLANAYLAVLLQRSGSGVHWHPISFAPRVGGVPSVRWGRFVQIGLRTVRDFWGLRRAALRVR